MQNWDQACEELMARDATLAKVMTRFLEERLTPSGDAFTTLANAIVGQQISVVAAAAIWERLLKLASIARRLDPLLVRRLSDEDLRTVGLSKRKVEYLRALAASFLDGQFASTAWLSLDDEALTSLLCKLPGIGPWTAHMFLIFHLCRPDVLPLLDIGLQRAFAKHYGHSYSSSLDKKKLLGELSDHADQNWRPWRTVATWYLWRDLDPQPVAY